MKVISKSRFVSGVQCEKKLYFDIYRKDLKPTVTEEQEALFNTGHKVGNLAQQLFPDGKDASPENYFDFSKSIQDTANWINAGINTIYEAAFSVHGILAALDILHHQNGERWAIEVKSSTEVKEYHIKDASLQYWVMNKSGCRPEKFFIMHINNNYIRNGSLEINMLFKLEDITEKVIENQTWVSDKLSFLKEAINSDVEPVKEIGLHCDAPFSCDYKHHCWKHIPANSVFDLAYAKGKNWEFYKKGILKIADIPVETILTHRQQVQVDGIKTNSSYLDKVAINEFINTWQYPLYFFDFETIFPAIPIVDQTSPFQQVPFQYSLHVLDYAEAELHHKEYLADPKLYSSNVEEHPCKKLIEQMKLDFGSVGSIVAYNATFEIGVLKKLAILFPAETSFIESLIERFVDLLIPFRNAWFYTPEMGSSASIKSVLPAIAPSFSYKDLVINNGGLASNTFLSMIYGEFNGDLPLTRKHMLAYCERDTEGMVVIYKALLDKLY